MFCNRVQQAKSHNDNVLAVVSLSHTLAHLSHTSDSLLWSRSAYSSYQLPGSDRPPESSLQISRSFFKINLQVPMFCNRVQQAKSHNDNVLAVVSLSHTLAHLSHTSDSLLWSRSAYSSYQLPGSDRPPESSLLRSPAVFFKINLQVHMFCNRVQQAKSHNDNVLAVVSLSHTLAHLSHTSDSLLWSRSAYSSYQLPGSDRPPESSLLRSPAVFLK